MVLKPRHRHGPPPAVALRELDESALRAAQDAFLAGHPREADLWVFAYGSLLWNPEVESAESRLADLAGWHRSFCLWQWRHRGSPEAPNLMLALDRGGRCRGVALRIRGGADLPERLLPLSRRELSGGGYVAAWVEVQAGGERLRALTFVVNHANRARYAGKLPEARVAAVIAAARGEKGTGADYLRATERALRAAGVFDRRLARLRALVSARGGMTETPVPVRPRVAPRERTTR